MAVRKPESQMERKSVLTGTNARKAAQWMARREASAHFLACNTYLIESKRQYKKRIEYGNGQ